MFKTICPISLLQTLPTPIQIIGNVFYNYTTAMSYIATSYKLDLPLTDAKSILSSFDKLKIMLETMMGSLTRWR
jgi:hypothetical protein